MMRDDLITVWWIRCINPPTSYARDARAHKDQLEITHLIHLTHQGSMIGDKVPPSVFNASFCRSNKKGPRPPPLALASTHRNPCARSTSGRGAGVARPTAFR
jgi:hypothetical protein